MDEKPPDFDWVSARSQCSVLAVFKELERQAEIRTKQRQAALTDRERQNVAFRFETNATGFIVIADNLERTVRFTRHGEIIEIVGDGPDGDLRFEVKLTLTNEGDCRLSVKGKDVPLQPWQVLRMALEGLFFDLRTRRERS